MTYVLVLVGILFTLAWVTPARDAVWDAISGGAEVISETARDPDNALARKATELRTRLRARAMEFLRGEMHEAVDDMVK